MVTFVLDASALMRYVDNEAGADRVTEILVTQGLRKARVLMSEINWGEITTTLRKRHGSSGIATARQGFTDVQVNVIAGTASRAVRGAEIKFKYKIPYADAFCIELAGDSPDHILVTADFDFKPAESDVHIEFLPPKPKA